MAHPLDDAINFAYNMAASDSPHHDFWQRLTGNLRKATEIEEWQTMESAPRDGREILVEGRRSMCQRKTQRYKAYWDEHAGCFVCVMPIALPDYWRELKEGES